jgi:hypothetical protein
MAKRYCVCGKNVTVRNDGTPRSHTCNAPDGPDWRDELVTEETPEQPIVPADVDETECTHPRGFTWGDDGNGHEGSVCRLCGAEEPYAPEETDSPTEELLRVIDDQPYPADNWGSTDEGPCRGCEDCSSAAPTTGTYGPTDADRENWNGTGRPRPSASNVTMPPAEPKADSPRLLDMLAAGSAGAGTVLDAMTPQQRAAVCAEIPCPEPGVVQRMEAASFGAQQMADAFSMPTPQGSGPVRGSVEVPMWDGETRAILVPRDAAPDPFTAPTATGVPLGSATDQPQTWRNSYGHYVIKDPRTGDYKRNGRGKPQGFTRATTFAKTLIDQFGIHQWEMRTLLAGLALRPDLVRRASGLDVAADKDALQDIIAAAKDAAGGNDAATDGTDFHTVTEWIDAGRMKPEEAPEKFRPEALAYAREMERAGLQTRPEWIERVLFTDRVGEDVAGTADRILQERNGQHVIGDVKSGKGVDLGQREIAMQLKHYAMAVNQFGLYKKTSPPPRQGTDEPPQTGYWEPWTGPPVSEEYGIVMHVPLVRPEGTPEYCDIYRIDLRGVVPYAVDRAHHGAAWVRGWRKEKGFLSPYQAPATATLTGHVRAAEPAPRRTWAEAFASVTTPEEANRLWQAAVDAGMDEVALTENVELARQALQPQ